jgi:hypothetical protein
MKELLTKLHKIQSTVHSVDKNGVNNFQKYSYVTLNDILNSVRPLLAELGLVITQSVTAAESDLVFTDGAHYSKSSVQMDTTIWDAETGQSLTVGSTAFSTDKNSDKAAFKAETGARKYGLLKVLNLDTKEAEPEDDGEQPRQRATTKPAAVTRGKLF